LRFARRSFEDRDLVAQGQDLQGELVLGTEPGLFNPRKLNTDQWMEAAKAMGAKYAVLVAKHGSGFMCWQSDLYPYGMKESPYKNGQGDIVRDFVNSCRKYGIRPGIYAHMGCNGYLEVDNPGLVNRGKGGDPEKQARYARICEGMLTELWGNYGALSEIWFDGGVLDPGKGGPDMLPILPASIASFSHMKIITRYAPSHFLDSPSGKKCGL